MTSDITMPVIEPMAGSLKPTLHEDAAMRAFRRHHRIDPDAVRRMQYVMYRLADPIPDAMTRLGDDGYEKVREWFDLEPVRVVDRHNSSMDGSVKLVMEARDGARFETVLLRANTARTSVCISTQVGCRAGCTFCATARMGLRRNLTWIEIIEQVLIASRIAREEHRRVRNLVFMGMGEPLHNETELYQALDLLLAPLGFGFAPRRITVSTVGVPEAMLRLADRYPAMQIALSLHSARPELRAKLVPWTRQHDWQELQDALRDIANRPPSHRQQVVMIEHLMLAGVNDQPEDADALIEYLRGIPSIVNLIPYNPIPYAPNWQPTSRDSRGDFAQRLRDAGIFTTIRYSMGSDVKAACGQLVQK